MQSRCKKYIQHAVRIIAGCFLIFIMKETGVGTGIINGRVFAEKGKQEIADGAVRMMLPALVYAAEKDQTDTPSKDLAWAVMRWLWPAGAFMTEQGKEETSGEDSRTYAMILEKQENDENAVDKNGKLITQNPDTEEKETWKTPVVKADISMEKLRDYEYLMSHFYTVDSSTMADEGLINADKLMGKDMKLNPDTKGAKVLIYHTHSQEQFADSVPGDAGTSIVGMGTYLSELLNQKYGISTYHHEGVYDLVNGKLDRSKAYQLAEPDVQKILKENPAIEVVIDLHRDGVAEGTHLVTEIDGKPTAQIMFFNGLSRTRANGNISYLSNPYLEDNLAFSLQMEIAAATYYPGFARHIFLRAYRYNMHFKPKTLLIEADQYSGRDAQCDGDSCRTSASGVVLIQKYFYDKIFKVWKNLYDPYE